MYLHFFHLKEEPFTMTPDPRFLFLSHQHEAAIASLSYGVSNRKGFMTLTGEIGTGKTTICRELMNHLDPHVEIAVVLNPLLSVPGLLRAINRDFGNETKGTTAEDELEGLNRFLLNRINEGHNAVVLIDEAQNLSIEALEMTRLLSNLETEKQKLLQIILVGQPELMDKLKLSSLRQLNQRVAVRYHVLPLEAREVERYIHHRLKIGGANGNLLFTPAALEKIYRHSQGTPRLVNIICDRALLAGFVAETFTIDENIINQCIEELT